MILSIMDEGESETISSEEAEMSLLQWQGTLCQPKGRTGCQRFIGTLISGVIIFVLSMGVSLILPEGARGAGGKAINRMFQGLSMEMAGTGLKGNYLLLKAPEREVAAKIRRAVDLAPFSLKFPAYLPSQVTLSEVVITECDSFEVYSIFTSTEKSFVLSQRNSSTSAISVMLDLEDEQIKEVYNASFKGIFSPNFDGTNNLLSFVDDSNVHFLLYGEIDEAELVKIALSLETVFN